MDKNSSLSAVFHVLLLRCAIDFGVLSTTRRVKTSKEEMGILRYNCLLFSASFMLCVCMITLFEDKVFTNRDSREDDTRLICLNIQACVVQ